MVEQKHFEILIKGVDAWNAWRQAYPDVRPDLDNVDLCHLTLVGADFHNASLRNAKLIRMDLRRTNFHGADLDTADLGWSNLTDVDLGEANLRMAHLYKTNFEGADLRKTILRGADMVRAQLMKAKLGEADLRWVKLGEADLREADLTGSSVYAISAWEVNLEGAKQSNLVITTDKLPPGAHKDLPNITVDNLEVAQFIYMLRNQEPEEDS